MKPKVNFNYKNKEGLHTIEKIPFSNILHPLYKKKITTLNDIKSAKDMMEVIKLRKASLSLKL